MASSTDRFPLTTAGGASPRNGESRRVRRARSRTPPRRGAGPLPVLFVLACSALTACRLAGPDMELTVVLPAPPEHWAETFPALEAQVRFPACGGVGELACPWSRGGVTVDAAKASVIPVAARPLTPHEPLPPCGALFPADLDASGALRLSWERGFAADLLLRLWEGGVETSCFNAERFCREIEERFEDPWELDEAHMVRRILAGSFRVTDLKQLPSREVVLPAGPGSWFSESPLSGLWEADPSGSLSVRLTWGRHRLFRLGGGCSWQVAVSGDDIVALECGVRRLSRSGAEAAPAENRAAASPRSGSP